MKKPGAEVATLTPSASGWRLAQARFVREPATLAEAAPLIASGATVHLALPCHTAVLERFTLPSGDPAELAGMAQLQLEKTLPYPVEEVTTDLVVLEQGAEESTVLSIAVHTPVVEDLCAPLRAAERLPVRVTLYAQQVAAKAQPDEIALLLWKEQEHLVLAVSERGRLGWAQVVPSVEAEAFADEVAALLLGAEMNGVPTNFSRILLATECSGYAAAFREAIEAPVEIFPLSGLPAVDSGNLLPSAWAAQAGQLRRSENLRQRLLLAAVVYLLLVAAAFLYLAWTKRQLQTLQLEAARTRPLIEATRARQKHWEAVAPATDPARYAVEVIWQVYQSRPGPEVHITQLDCAPAQFMVEGEAPSAAVAIDFAERLRAEPGLAEYHVEAGPPQILPNESAQFRIFGKL